MQSLQAVPAYDESYIFVNLFEIRQGFASVVFALTAAFVVAYLHITQALKRKIKHIFSLRIRSGTTFVRRIVGRH